MAKTKSVMMVLNRKTTIGSNLGHMISFEKDVPIPVPEIMVRTCAEAGAVRADGEETFKHEEKPVKTQAVDPSHRLADIRKAIETIVEMNEREDFTAGGSPTVAAVSRETEYRVDRAEVARAWQQRNEDLANGTE